MTPRTTRLDEMLKWRTVLRGLKENNATVEALREKFQEFKQEHKSREESEKRDGVESKFMAMLDNEISQRSLARQERLPLLDIEMQSEEVWNPM